MSYSKYVTLWCDGEDCHELHGHPNETYHTAGDAREGAAKAGWTYKAGSDYCSDCSGN